MVQPLVQPGDSFEQPQTSKPAPPAVTPKPVTPRPVIQSRPTFAKAPVGDAGLDWLEHSFGQRRGFDDSAKKAKELEEEKKRKEQLEKLKELDKRQSRQMYEEIQQQIQLVRRKKASRPAQYVTGATGYNPEQHQNPESFWDKIKKKQEEAKKKLLPWTSQQGMGTGEITRGVSG